MTIISDEEAEKCEYLICAELTVPLALLDNLVGVCGMCGKGIQYRPSAPVSPMKICAECYGDNVREDSDEITVTQTTADELKRKLI